MKKAFIACGGTGGHLSPGIAVAEALADVGYSSLLLISNKQVDSRLVQKYSNLEFLSIPGSGLSLSPIRLVRFVLNLVSGTWLCYRRIHREKPSFVIGFGGFISMPALLAGKLARLPTAIHEANGVPGRVTRIVSKFVDRVYLPDAVTLANRPSEVVKNIGMPVRKEIQRQDAAKARETLGLDPNLRTLLVFGGSQGAQSLNTWVSEQFDELASLGVQVFCLTGPSQDLLEDKAIGLQNGSIAKALFRPFSDDMAAVLSASSLVISRAGAGSISEIIRCQVPAILIPYPFAADNHQQANAASFQAKGCGLVLDQADLGNLIGTVREILLDENRYESFLSSLKAMEKQMPQIEIAKDLEQLTI
ncbi:UDP-N-acetylglucosamine--N-acetylmuramyl-(pentapeptide) pyrophosphoryl-undecaprenol N-acetylglucosamine transferase [Puniceicoccaceae bacterium K14]|nr:UDP-N-acetylglucosamine--N-acetylmuramyl-(pentapeptide) pyrophosphoryl-undecaprenol N-acetylglucosamine transferase [Puniceicoccaceae bacterium K14]